MPHRKCKRKHNRHARALAAVVAALCLTAQTHTPTQAQTSPYYLGISLAVLNDSNVFRSRDNSVLPTGLSRADTVITTSLLAGIDQPIGRQRVFGTLSLSDNRYANNDYLNYPGYGLNAGVDWSTVERISGTLSMRANQVQRKFNESSGATIDPLKNIENSLGVDAAFRVGAVTKWSAEASLGFSRVGYSNPAFANSETDQRSASIGTRWSPSSIINFGSALRYTLGNYPARNDRFTAYSIDLTSAWTPGGASSAYIRLSPTRLAYDNATASDFSGLTGAATWQWQPTGKLQLNTTLSRDTNEDSYNQRLLVPVSPTQVESLQITTNDVNSTTRLRIALDYAATGKIAATTSASVARRSLNRTNSLVALSDDDLTSTVSLGARWSPTRGTQLGCEFARESRTTGRGVLSLPYRANTFGCTGQLLLR